MIATIVSKSPSIDALNMQRVHGLKSTILMATGSTAGQLMVVGAMPLITRLYSPSEMGLYAIFTATVGLLATVVALHYELAIPLPKSDFYARLLAKLALIVASSVALLSLGIIIVFGTALSRMVGIEKLPSIAYLIPVTLLITGLLTVLTYRAIRLKTFRLTATGKALQGIVQTAIQIGYGLSGAGTNGLIYGTAMGQCAAIFVLARNGFWREVTCGWRSHKTKFFMLTRRYKNFPSISTPSSFINAAVAQLPVMVLAAWFDIRVVGLYALGVRILQAPARFIGDSLSQVFFSMAADAHRNGTLEEVVSRTWRVQTAFALHSFLPLAAVSPELFSVVFGHEWREGGVYTQLILPWIMTSFISTSLSILVTVLQRQKQEFVFQVVYLSVLLCALWFGHAHENEYLAMASIGIGASVLLAGKMAWLLHIAGVNLAAQGRWLSKELCYSTLPLIILLLMKVLNGSELLMVCAATIIIFTSHFVNYLVRKAYAF